LSRVNEEEVAELDASHGLLVDLDSPHFKDADYLELILRVEVNADKLPDIKVSAGLVYRRGEHTSGEAIHDTFCWKLWVPQGLVPEALKKAHNDPFASHGGVQKTVERLRRYYYWPGLVRDVKQYIEGCITCKTTKA